MNISVVGTGYVGIVTAVCLAKLGHIVTCVDVDERKIRELADGKPTIYETGLSELMEELSDRLHYTTDLREATADADVIFIAVGTPEKKDGSANLKYVFQAAREIAKTICRNCTIVLKSTLPIGTNKRIESVIKKELGSNIKVHVASNPEFLSQGTAIEDTLNPSRIVIGVESEEAEAVLRDVYKDIDAPVLVTNRESAEMIKYASNDFLALKISYINEIANLCEKVGADIQEVTKGMGYDGRIGSKFLNAGIGYGGSCFPKDTKALHWLSNNHGHEIKTIKAAIEVNEQQKVRLIKKSRQFYSSFEGLKVCVLGLSFKPETDDMREAPSLDNIPIIIEEGAVIHAWDNVGRNNFLRCMKHSGEEDVLDRVIFFDTPKAALHETDICFIFTEWKEIKELLPCDFLKMKTPIIVDGRNCFKLEDMKSYPLVYESIGRRRVGRLKINENEVDV